MLKIVLAVCSTAVAIANLYLHGDGATMTAVIGFWGVLLGAEVQKEASRRQIH